MKLIVFATPVTPITLAVAKEFTQESIEECNIKPMQCFYNEFVPAAGRMCKIHDVQEAGFFGPAAYVTKLAKQLKNKYPTVKMYITETGDMI